MEPKIGSRQTNRFSLKGWLLLSFLGHGLLLGLLVYPIYNMDQEIRSAGPANYSFVAISLVNGMKGSLAVPSSLTSSATDSNTNEGGEGGTSEILRQIRTKIERNKFYPLMAKRQGIEGSSLVEFQIDGDGRVKDLQLKQTSGSEILDNAAKQAVEGAQPFPFYADPIALSIHYALGD